MPKYARPSVAARLYHLAVGTGTLFLVRDTVQATMNHIHSVSTTTPELRDRRYSTQKWLLVREGVVPQYAVLVTRLA